MVQLMAIKEMVTMKQGLLDFGTDFEADLAGAAEWIERNIKAINESMARWADDAWCAQEGNTDPIAAMADAFWNLRRSLRDARVYVQAQNGERTVLVRRDASAETWAKAEEFLTRR